MKLPLSVFPEHIKRQYNFENKAKNGYFYVKIRRSIYSLPQARKLANTDLKEHFTLYGYFEVAHTPVLWRHITRPIKFSLVVDDFGVKYVHKDDTNHFANSPKNAYQLAEDWTGGLYCGITLKLNYNKRDRWLEISMPGYIKKQLSKYKHPTTKWPQHSPYPCTLKTYDKSAQDLIPTNNSPPSGQEGITHVQKVVGSILYYSRLVDSTLSSH